MVVIEIFQIVKDLGCLLLCLRTPGKFNTDDYLLLMGDPVLIGITCAVAAKKTNNNFKVLKWDRESNIYIPITIELK